MGGGQEVVEMKHRTTKATVLDYLGTVLIFVGAYLIDPGLLVMAVGGYVLLCAMLEEKDEET